jgi:hypothetical protein
MFAPLLDLTFELLGALHGFDFTERCLQPPWGAHNRGGGRPPAAARDVQGVAYRPVGTYAFSSSSQLSTRLMCVTTDGGGGVCC